MPGYFISGLQTAPRPGCAVAITAAGPTALLVWEQETADGRMPTAASLKAKPFGCVPQP